MQSHLKKNLSHTWLAGQMHTNHFLFFFLLPNCLYLTCMWSQFLNVVTLYSVQFNSKVFQTRNNHIYIYVQCSLHHFVQMVAV